MATEVSVLCKEPATLGECPVWCDRERVVYWVDIDGGAVHRTDIGSGATESRAIGGRPTALALTRAPGRLVLAVERRLHLFDWHSGELIDLWTPATPDPRIERFNDGRCDTAGRFVIGSMCRDRRHRVGELLRFDGPRQPDVIRRNLGVPNGLAFDSERNRMYLADTASGVVVIVDYDMASGRVGRARPFVDFGHLPGRPDGGCVDEAGCYWSAAVYGWSLLRFTPRGRLDRTIELPLHKPSMPCFAGPRLDTMVVTTIGNGGATPSEPVRDGFEPGQLLALDVGIRGVPEPVASIDAQTSGEHRS